VPVNSERVAETEFRSLDGIRLRGTLVIPSEKSANAAVLVHGGGVTRHEGGFFTRLASGLAEAGIPSLRFDIRGHGESEGRQEDLTISGIVNDIRSAVEHIRGETGSHRANVIGASFGGGISAFYASRYPGQVGRLALINPLLNYKKRFIDDKPYWHDEHISHEAGEELSSQGFIPHSPTFKLGRPLLNEVFYIQPHLALGHVTAPALIVHGTKDTFVPVESSRQAVSSFAGEARLVEIDGAQHGIAVPEDPQYQDPQTREWQAYAIRTIAEWLTIGG
jgi:alpha-beta hydrolase superfamily lysophospholipase